MSQPGQKDEPSMHSLQGRVIGDRYRLVQYKAEGNFGAVFLSEQIFFGLPTRRVAVKVSKKRDIAPEQARELFADMFTLAKAMDEMKDAIARSRLVHVYDVGSTDDNRIFYVMEYVDGPTLQDELRRAGRADVTQLLRWTRQIAEALAGLHALRSNALVHRDLKPDNILLGADHAVRVVDFGLTARLNDRGWVPGVAGTTTYMAPETTRGRSVPASDIYSVGLIMYQALTGELPFDELVPPVGMPADQHSVWLTQQKERIVILPPSRRNPAVPEKVDRLILGCLQPSPNARIANGTELLHELDKLNHEEKPDEAALTEGRRARGAGDRAGAEAAWERGLRVAQPNAVAQAGLLRELALLAEETGKRQTALERWIQLWERVKGSGVLMPNSKERVELLDRIIALAQQANNQFQVDQYRSEKQRRFPTFR